MCVANFDRDNEASLVAPFINEEGQNNLIVLEEVLQHVQAILKMAIVVELATETRVEVQELLRSQGTLIVEVNGVSSCCSLKVILTLSNEVNFL